MHVKTLRRALIGGVVGMTFFGGGLRGFAATDAPDAQTILKNARVVQASQNRTLKGHLLVNSSGQKIPFVLILAGDQITYQFKDREIILQLGPSGSQLMEAGLGESAKKVAPVRYDKPVEGTDITYEDLALRFFYWPKAKVEGSETVDMLNCWKLHLEPGSGESAYASMELWISMKQGTFMRGEGHDAIGKLVKTFRVASGQTDPDGGWMLKRMVIETPHPGASETVTSLFIDK